MTESISTGAAYAILFVTLVLFGLHSAWVSRNALSMKKDDYFSARGSSSTWALTWSFFASGMGSWVLYTIPESGVIFSLWGVIGYAIANALPLLFLPFLGGRIRDLLGDEGVSWTDFILRRYGWVMQMYIGIVSMAVMFVFLVGELTGIGLLVNSFAPGVPVVVPIITMCVVTIAYTVVGGLPATLATDRVQGSISLMLIGLAFIAMVATVDIPGDQLSEVAKFTSEGFEGLVILVLAVTASTFFLTGYWQRVWAAKDQRTLLLSCIVSSMMIMCVSVLLGVTGLVAVAINPDVYPSLSFFELLTQLGQGWWYVVLVLAVALVASSVDTIQNSMTAEFVQLLQKWKIDMKMARVLSILVNVPAIVLALKQQDLLTLFLIADLITTTAVTPVFLGLWKKTHKWAALAGCLAGLLSVLIQGWIISGTFAGGFEQIALPNGLYATDTMVSFILALCFSTVTTVALSLIHPDRRDTLLGPSSYKHDGESVAEETTRPTTKPDIAREVVSSSEDNVSPCEAHYSEARDGTESSGGVSTAV